jgi:hypothetical protein
MRSSFKLRVDNQILKSNGVDGCSFFDMAVLVSTDHIIEDGIHVFA